MLKIYPAYQQADFVVLASPMYYWGFSGQLKTAFDRLFAIAELDPDYRNPIKACALLMASEGDSEDNFAPVKNYFESLLQHLGWENAGVIYAGGNMNIGDILSKPHQLEAARQLGSSI